MAAPSGGLLRVEVVFALHDRQKLVALQLEPGATVAQAIEASAIANAFPECDVAACEVGIWGHVVERGRRLRDGDRVEIYRPLQVDPQTARRQRAADEYGRGPHGRGKTRN
jgi:putative ubiquitin-RnfH superfamily antitoxin RatB of RatAB toxin-antitoxin module